MKILIPVIDKNKKYIPYEIEAKDIFDAIKKARKMKLDFVDDYITICWYNGNNID